MSVINSERRAPLNYVEGADYENLVNTPNRAGVLQVTGGVDASGNARAIQMSGATGAGGVVIDDDAILAALAAVLRVRTVVLGAGNIMAVTNAVTPANYVAFAAQACIRLIIVNTSGAVIEVQQGGAGATIWIPNNAAFTFEGLTNTNQIAVRDSAAGAVAYNVRARWEA